MSVIKHIRKFLYRRYLDFNHTIGKLESIQISEPEAPLPHRPVFILGAPRCGSTLTYQTLASTLDVSYFSNRHCFWFGAPWLVELLSDAPSKFRQNPVFQSRHGFTEGWYAPSECAEYWYRFFRRFPPYISGEEVNPKSMNQFRASFHAFLKVSQKPFLVKNLYSVLRLEPLLQTFPEAVFLVIHRNPKDIAHSILKARQRKFGNYNEWFSLETPGFEDLKTEPPEVQVAEQIRSTYRLIDEAEEQFQDTPFLHFNYEDFCKNPDKKISDITDFLRKSGVDISQVSDAPTAFEMRDEVTIDPVLYERLSLYLAENPIS